ncbi:hypothetical protein GRJ2_003174100 [Grus japonensis]|uniref:Integrase zinc-binding domain-containing protein n=1 Tax=Grus japonensis TaxID=30415 RepID=A0ABC9YAK3_GRUJA
MGPVASWESIEGGRLLYGVLHDESQKLLKEKPWKQSNWQRRGKPIWAAPLWQDIAARLEKLVVKVRHVDAHVPKNLATEDHQNNQQVDQAAKIEVAQVDLDWQRKGELFIARWAHDTSGHQGRDATYRWARDRGLDLTVDAIAQVIHECETCAAIKQAKQVKPLWYGGRWLKYKYGETWQIDYITLPQTCQGRNYVLTMVKTTPDGWKHIPCSMPPPVTLSRVLKSKSCGDMAPQKESSQKMGLIFGTTSSTPGPKSMALSGCITSPTMHQPLGKLKGTMDC